MTVALLPVASGRSASLLGVRRVLMLRHGESEWNVEGRWQGWEDIALTIAGEHQAAARAHALAADDGLEGANVFSSDLRRARRTAEIVAEALGLGPVVVDEGLRERCGGEWQGRTGAEIEERWPGMREAWRRGELAAPPGGESNEQLLDRVDAALGRAIAATPEDRVTLVVTHHGVLRALLRRVGQLPVESIPNLGGHWFDWDGDRLLPRGALPPLADLPPAEAPTAKPTE